MNQELKKPFKNLIESNLYFFPHTRKKETTTQKITLLNKPSNQKEKKTILLKVKKSEKRRNARGVIKLIRPKDLYTSIPKVYYNKEKQK